MICLSANIKPSWLLKPSFITISLLSFLSTQVAAAPEIIKFWLVDATTNTRLVELEDYQRLTLPYLPSQMSIEAETNDETQSVIMKIDDVESSSENVAPYALKGDYPSGDFNSAPELRVPGWISVSAQPYSVDNAGGTAGLEKSLSLYLYKPDFLVTNNLDIGDYNPGDGYCSTTKPLGLTLQLDTANVTEPVLLGEQTKIKDDNQPKKLIKNKPVLTKSDSKLNFNPELGITSAFFEPPSDIANPYIPNLTGCTLRAAIEEANALAGTQSILVDGTKGTYNLSLGQLDITEGVTVRGHKMPIIDAHQKSRIFFIDGKGENIIVNIQGLDMTRGKPIFDGRGGAIYIYNEALVQMSDSIVRESRGNFGGGIYLQTGADLTMWRSAIRDNIAGTPDDGIDGGGITQRGGGIFNSKGNITIYDSSIYDNLAVRGGGLSNYGGTMRIENSSILGNKANAYGGGIENRHQADKNGILHLSFVTIANNMAGASPNHPVEERTGGGLYNTGWAYMASSIMTSNTDFWYAGDVHHSPDCYSPDKYDFKSYRNNIVGVLNNNCSFTDYAWGNDGLIDYGTESMPLDPGLMLRQYQGDLAYHYILNSSIALDNGGSTSSIYPCKDHDMRGKKRPVNGICDIGAIERQ